MMNTMLDLVGKIAQQFGHANSLFDVIEAQLLDGNDQGQQHEAAAEIVQRDVIAHGVSLSNIVLVIHDPLTPAISTHRYSCASPIDVRDARYLDTDVIGLQGSEGLLKLLNGSRQCGTCCIRRSSWQVGSP
jgi:hypothetical protein